MDKNITNKLRVIGNPKDIEKFETLITPYQNFESYHEPHARKIIQEIIDNPDNRLRQLTVLFDGNTVWSAVKLVSAIRKIVKNNDMTLMTKYLYDFLHLSCGSIAHYNMAGWVETYPTVGHLRRFFWQNEYGSNVLGYQPHWKTDAIHAIKEIKKVLRF